MGPMGGLARSKFGGARLQNVATVRSKDRSVSVLNIWLDQYARRAAVYRVLG